jgi:tetratricopeptide (TPR) repeat protein
MTVQKIKFMGREQEIDNILTAIQDWDTQRVLFIKGNGGVGKTTLLAKVNELIRGKTQQHQHKQGKQQYRILDTIDLDDIRLQSSEAISIKIINQVGLKTFDEYVQKLKELKEFERETKISKSEMEDEAFIKCYSAISDNIRTVIFCDTTDAVKTETGRASLKFLLALTENLKNIVLIMSGRDVDDLYDKFGKNLRSAYAELMLLGPLSPEASHEYLEFKQKSLHIVIDSDLAQKILFLSKGVPLLIDLAVEWRARAMPLAWLTDKSLEMLQSLPDEQQNEFEYHLVKHIEQLHSPLDRLVLTLSWVYPINIELCSTLLDLSEKQAEELFEDAKNISFIKTLPDGSIKLHDYMKSLVIDHIWNNVEIERRKRDSQVAAKHLEKNLNEKDQQRAALIEKLDNLEEKVPDLIELFLKKETLEREYWQTALELLKHALFADANQGVEIFCRLFDDAIRSQQYPFLDQIITMVLELQEMLERVVWFDVNMRYIRYLDLSRDYKKAEYVLNNIISGGKLLSGDQQVELLLKRGNIKIRSLKNEPIQAALDDFNDAIQLARSNDNSEMLGEAELETGWVYSSIGDWIEANEHFNEAFGFALETKNRTLLATVYNELAYIRFYEDVVEAKALCNEAIALRKELNDKPGLGRAYSTMGTILYRGSEYEEAVKYFQMAKDIFEPVKNREWMSIISSWLGITFCSQAEIELGSVQAGELLHKAENLIKDAIKSGVYREMARNLNRLARVYKNLGRYDDAKEQLLKAYTASLDIPDFIYEVASLRDISSFALELEEFDRYVTLKINLNECKSRGILLSPHGLGYGGALINIGIMGIYLGDSEFGFSSVAEGLRYSALGGKYGNFAFTKTLENFQELAIKWISRSDRQELAKYLKHYWEGDNELRRRHIEATRVFYKL